MAEARLGATRRWGSWTFVVQAPLAIGENVRGLRDVIHR